MALKWISNSGCFLVPAVKKPPVSLLVYILFPSALFDAPTISLCVMMAVNLHCVMMAVNLHPGKIICVKLQVVSC